MLESFLTNVTIPSVVASTGVFSGTIKSIAFLNFPMWTGDVVLSILWIEFLGTGRWYLFKAVLLSVLLSGTVSIRHRSIY